MKPTGDVNDAYVDYKATFMLAPAFPGLGSDLWRVARSWDSDRRLGAVGHRFGLTEEDHQAAMLPADRAHKAEIIVLYENGISPDQEPQSRTSRSSEIFPPLQSGGRRAGGDQRRRWCVDMRCSRTLRPPRSRISTRNGEGCR